MSLSKILQETAIESLNTLYGGAFSVKDFQVNQTKPEFEGDYTVVLFSLVKNLKRSPDEIGNELGKSILENKPDVFSKFNIIKGFLNLTVTDKCLIGIVENTDVKNTSGDGKTVMVEYSSPNTNKPLHLGHLRNNFLGWSVAEILKANGNKIIKSCIVNDRGIHICKSMIAWQLFANGATPQSTHTKGDHFVGDYYVKFNDEYKKQVEELVAKGMKKEEAEKEAPIMKGTQQMLQDWEAGEPEVMALWSKMNSWVYEGFDITYKRIGSDFDRTYYESQTYLLGKDIIQEGIEKGVLNKKEDGSVWVDLTADNLDEKLLLRKDGTAVYMTQDVGLAKQKFEEYHLSKSIYVIGDEQNHHMKVLKACMRKLGMPFAEDIYHLSYGMVELPSGKMKSREGTVVDADDLVEEMISTAKRHTEELGKVKDFSETELKDLFEVIGIGAMKFYLLRVDPKKKMVFNPEESIDFHGFTGPFVQYTYARIKSILRKVGDVSLTTKNSSLTTLLPLEKELLIQLEQYSSALSQAAEELSPSVICNYVFQLAKTFNSFYTEHSIANAESEEKKNLRLKIAESTASIIENSMQLLGIRVPERM